MDFRRSAATSTNRAPAGALCRSPACVGRVSQKQRPSVWSSPQALDTLYARSQSEAQKSAHNPQCYGCFDASASVPKTEDMHEMRPPSLISTSMSPLQNCIGPASEVRSGLSAYPRKQDTHSNATRRSHVGGHPLLALSALAPERVRAYAVRRQTHC